MADGNGTGEGSGTGEGGGTGGERRPNVIPMDRFEEVYGKHMALKRDFDTRLEAQVTERTSDLQAQLDAERAARAEDKALFGAGLTDEDAQDAARMLYAKVPEADRPEGGIAAWLDGFGEGEGKTAPPRLLAPFLGAPEQKPTQSRGRPTRAQEAVPAAPTTRSQPTRCGRRVSKRSAPATGRSSTRSSPRCDPVGRGVKPEPTSLGLSLPPSASRTGAPHSSQVGELASSECHHGLFV
jgi:hypothetical protein